MKNSLLTLVIVAVSAGVGTAPTASQESTPTSVAARGGAPDLGADVALTPVDATAVHDGLVAVDGDGRVVALGGATTVGDLSGVALNAPIVGIAATPTGNGYWLVASDGGVFAFGDAPFLGSMGATTLNQPVVGIAATPTGNGYWLVASDGGVFAFGDAPFLGADVDGGVPVVDLAPSPGGGYWVALADGTVRAAGDAAAADGATPTGATVAIVPASAGYWLVGTGSLLPGSTAEVFDGRMLVAHYGSPLTPALGVLGENDADASADRIIARAAEFESLGRPTLPAMEIIATIATSFPGVDGDYSSPTDPAILREWIDVAADRGLYVLLDLQPGRSDFLTQAQLYQELLLEPHVGLAIDPEWRMGPTQVPGRVIGSVDGNEVNAVTAWLDELVAANGLPEKLFVVHQFTEAMVIDRAAIVDRPHLAVTFHIDGFGTQAQKLAKYRQLRPDEPYDIGLKLFIDEDTRMFTPAEVLALDVVPDLVTYQ